MGNQNIPIGKEKMKGDVYLAGSLETVPCGQGVMWGGERGPHGSRVPPLATLTPGGRGVTPQHPNPIPTAWAQMLWALQGHVQHAGFPLSL